MGRLGNEPDIGFALGLQLLQQGARGGGKRDASLGHVARLGEAERGGEAARRRHAELRRPDKREQFEEVERGESRYVEAPGDRARMAHHRGLALQPGARLGRRQRLDLAVGRQPQDLVKPGDQRRRARHQNAIGQAGGGERQRAIPDPLGRARPGRPRLSLRRREWRRGCPEQVRARGLLVDDGM